MTKKIAVDFRTMDTPSGRRGIGYLTFNQFQALEELGHEDIDFLYYVVWKGEWGKTLKLTKNSKFFDILSSYRPSRGIRRLDPLFSRFWRMAVKKTKPDLIHITSLFDTIYIEIPKDIPSVVTFYDLIPFFNLEKYFGNEKARNWYKNRLNQLKHATRILAISQSVKDDLVKNLDLPAEKIQVVYGGFNDRFKVLDRVKSFQQISKQYGIKNKFILAQPAFSAHKNVERIFLGFKKFIETTKKELDLVVVCKLIPIEEKIWGQKLKELKIRDKVILTNFVPDEDLPHFYNTAEVLLFPSLHEGFGLPILEAMACGCPVITSNTSSMPEAGGDAAFYVNPESVDEITKALVKLVDNQKLKEQMVKKGFAQIKKFSWEKCAKETLEIYRELLSDS